MEDLQRYLLPWSWTASVNDFVLPRPRLQSTSCPRAAGPSLFGATPPVTMRPAPPFALFRIERRHFFESSVFFQSGVTRPISSAL